MTPSGSEPQAHNASQAQSAAAGVPASEPVIYLQDADFTLWQGDALETLFIRWSWERDRCVLLILNLSALICGAVALYLSLR